MLYVIADTAKSQAAGFNPLTHRTEGKPIVLNGYREARQWIVLNEKEVRFSAKLTGTLEERAEALGGKVYTLSEARDELTRIRIEYRKKV